MVVCKITIGYCKLVSLRDVFDTVQRYIGLVAYFVMLWHNNTIWVRWVI